MTPTYHRTIALPKRALSRAAPVVATLVLGALGAVGAVDALGALASHADRSAAGAAVQSSPMLVIDGAGDGHGVGMSQEGAYGYAQHGYSYTQILAHYYTGTAIGAAPASAQVRVLIDGRVHPVPLESYVRGVVAEEMPSSWPISALEAQAVASRTYALTAHAGGSRFDVYADARSQVYRGRVAETARTDEAVAQTAGQIVTYQGRPAVTYFFASSGGMTEAVQNAFPGSSPEPWLVGVPDPYDQGPLHSWRVTISFAAAAARLRGLFQGHFEGIEVLARGFSPRILSAYVLGSRGRTQVSGANLEARLGLYATWAYFNVSHAGATTPEPELSGHHPPASAPNPAPTPEPAPTTVTLASPQGGVEADVLSSPLGPGGGTPS
jgi:SpoIID/LytB domain protein